MLFNLSRLNLASFYLARDHSGIHIPISPFCVRRRATQAVPWVVTLAPIILELAGKNNLPLGRLALALLL
jgi:hypothetical protein